MGLDEVQAAKWVPSPRQLRASHYQSLLVEDLHFTLQLRFADRGWRYAMRKKTATWNAILNSATTTGL